VPPVVVRHQLFAYLTNRCIRLDWILSVLRGAKANDTGELLDTLAPLHRKVTDEARKGFQGRAVDYFTKKIKELKDDEAKILEPTEVHPSATGEGGSTE